jgi:N-acetylmuramoyl-L-alanine amidase
MDKQIKLKVFITAFAIWCSLFVLSGCIYNDEPLPQIVFDPTRETSPIPPPTVEPRTTWKAADKNIPPDWLPPWRLERKWTAIVIHHSDTANGSATIFDKYHKEIKYWEGIGYDFVIGNGTNSGDGQVEVTFRWREQRTGAHCKTPGNWANERAVGICLVGNFNQTWPTARQMRSLVKLVRFLQDRYGIPKSRIYGHNTTPGARDTDCPGKRFPMARLKSMLGS